jgi:hypothetical protein
MVVGLAHASPEEVTAAMSNILTQAGKGSEPRNNWSHQFRENYDAIDWGRKHSASPAVKSATRSTASGARPLRAESKKI